MKRETGAKPVRTRRCEEELFSDIPLVNPGKVEKSWEPKSEDLPQKVPEGDGKVLGSFLWVEDFLFWKNQKKEEHNMFILVIGGTKLSTTPGLSVAGSNPQLVPYTAPADADVILLGKPKVIDALPVDPEGHPTPAIISHASYLEANFPVMIVKAGTFLPPTVPYIETHAQVGKDPQQEKAVPEASFLFQKGKLIGQELSKTQPVMVLAESLPGGTTTAFCVLRALGYDGMVSSASPQNPTHLKEEVWQKVSLYHGLKPGSLRGKGLEAVEITGDPMQVVVAGMVAGCQPETKIVLAGGTQMLAVAGALRNMGYQQPLTVATTRYIIEDQSAHFEKIANQVKVKTYIAPLNFSSSPFPGLSDYEKGFVKEGVGAGGAVWYANQKGISTEQVIARVEKLYQGLIAPTSSN